MDDNNQKNSQTRMIVFLSILVVICISGSLFSSKKSLWVYSVSSKDKPITSCLEIDKQSWSAIVVSMNCQKSVIENIILCSQHRAVSMFNSQESCEKSRIEMLNLNGPYYLKTDPYENR